jgi:hypothetical protein
VTSFEPEKVALQEALASSLATNYAMWDEFFCCYHLKSCLTDFFIMPVLISATYLPTMARNLSDQSTDDEAIEVLNEIRVTG